MQVTFTEDFIDKVKKANDIVDVAREHFDLKQYGDVYKAHCKHPGGDKTPSLAFFPSTQSFYCFSCHAGKRDGHTEGSDVISFLQWVEGLSWQDAVISLAERAGIELPKSNLTNEERQKLLLYEAILIENRVNWSNLEKEEGLKVKEWFLNRGINQAEIAKWRLGASTYGKSKEMFPVYAIIDDQGRTAGFSYRLGAPDGKYKNSSTSPIFKKGNILYGLNFIKKDIREKGHIVIVEGYNDAIILQKYGIPAAAILSTSITDGQLTLIKKHTGSVILFLDGDDAGAKNTLVNTRLLKKEGLQVEVLNIKGFDPDEIALRYKEATPQFIQDNKRLAFQFLANSVLDKYFDEMLRLKGDTLKSLEEILDYIDDETERDIYKSYLLRIVSMEKLGSDRDV